MARPPACTTPALATLRPQPRGASLLRLPAQAPMLALLLGALSGCHSQTDPRALYAEAQVYFQHGENRAAIIQLKNVLQKTPNDGPARALLGQVYLDAGDGLSAEKELRKALELGVAPASIAPLLGQTLLLLGRFDSVLLEIVPRAGTSDEVALLALRANALLGLGRVADARTQFQQLLARQPDQGDALLGMARLALLDGRNADAERLLVQALRARPDDVAALRFRGDLDNMNGQPEAALRAYRRILQRHPENTRAYLDIANLQIQGQHLPEAAATLVTARKSAPGSLLIVHMQALLDFRAGRPKPALDGLQQVLRNAPDFMPALLLTAAVQLALGSYAQADDALQRFLLVYPQNLYAHKLQAQIALRLGKPAQALTALAPFLHDDDKLYRQDVELLTLAGEANMAVHAYDRAAAYFARASAIAPQSSTLHAALGASQLSLGEHARAIAELERAAGLDSAGMRPASMLVHAHLQAGDNDQALAAVTQLQRRQPNDSAVLNLKGTVLLAARQNDAARSAFEQALKLAPSSMPALDNLARLDVAAHRPDVAERRYRAALASAVGSDNVAIMTALARLATGSGQGDQAIDWLQQAANVDPGAVDPQLALASAYGRHGQRAKGLALAATLQATHPQDLDALALLAMLEYDSGLAAAALAHYQQLGAAQPNSAAVQIRLAQVYTQLGRPTDGLAAVRKALVLAPKSIEARVMLVTLLIADQQYPAALAAARALQQQVPGLSAGDKLEGDVWLAQRNGAAAVAPYQRALQRTPGPALLIRLHQALHLAGDDGAARQQADSWLKGHPDDSTVRLYLAANALLARAYPAAIVQLEAVLGRQPQNGTAVNDLAWAYLQIGDPRALATARRAFQLEPANPLVLDTLACVELARGEWHSALPQLQQAAALAPGNADIQLHLGMALAGSGDRRAARAQLERLLASSSKLPNRAEVIAVMAKL